MSDPRLQRPESNIAGKPEILTFPQDLGQEKTAQQHYMILTSHNTQVIKTQLNRTAAPSTDFSVALYIPPDGLKTSYSQKYETFKGFEAVITGAATAFNAAQQDNSAETGLSSDVADSNIVMDFIKSVTTDTAMSNIAAEAAFDVGEFIAAKSDIGKAAIISSGLAMNPFLTVFYSGPGDFRTHTFTFDFLARNQRESVTINKIINGLRFRMLPGKFTSLAHSYFLRAPHQFQIDFYINGKIQNDTNGKLFTIKRSVITNMNVDYAGQGTPIFFKDTGEPFNVKMDLTFQELEILTRESFFSGHKITELTGEDTVMGDEQ